MTPFPNKLESVLALQTAIKINAEDALAPHLLGMFWYAHRQYEDAIACWERSLQLDSSQPSVLRNLGLAYANKQGDLTKAMEAYTRAFALAPDDARLLFELDQLAKKLNHPPAERLARLEAHADLVDQRDDLTIERIGLLNWLGRYAEAYARLMVRRFHPWEGGEGKVTGQYVASQVEMARQHLMQGNPAEAIVCLERAKTYPDNLGEGKLPGTQENNIDFYLGLAYRALGQPERAEKCFERAATGLSEPTSPMYYNDQPPDMIFYQGMARRALHRETEALSIFQKLVDYGRTHMDDHVQFDYFAVSLPDFLVFDEDLNVRNQIHCHYMMGLGYLGLGDFAAARDHLTTVLTLRSDHLGARIHLHWLDDQPLPWDSSKGTHHAN